jgi:hypothetical protein
MTFQPFGKAAFACAIAVAIVAPASASTTFAQFAQISTPSTIFSYQNVTSGPTVATLTRVDGGGAYLFADLGALSFPAITTVDLNATATALPTIGTMTTTQLFSGTLSFTLNTAQLGLSGLSTNALTVTFTDAALKATNGTSAPTLQADVNAGSTIVYSSGFADLSGLTGQNFSLSFSGGTAALDAVGGRLPDFLASGSGTFAADGAVPEPASWAMMLGGFGMMGTVLRSRRKTTIAFN